MIVGGVLVSLRGIPNKAFTEQAGITGAKRLVNDGHPAGKVVIRI